MALLLTLLFYLFIFNLGPHVWHMEVPRLGVRWEPPLPAYGTVTVTPDPRRICDLHRGSVQCQILNPLSWATDRTLMGTSRVGCWELPADPSCRLCLGGVPCHHSWSLLFSCPLAVTQGLTSPALQCIWSSGLP